MLPRWKIMVTEPDLPMDSLRRSISVFTRSMNAVRSLLTPLLLARTARALHASRRSASHRHNTHSSNLVSKVMLRPAIVTRRCVQQQQLF